MCVAFISTFDREEQFGCDLYKQMESGACSSSIWQTREECETFVVLVGFRLLVVHVQHGDRRIETRGKLDIEVDRARSLRPHDRTMDRRLVHPRLPAGSGASRHESS